MNYVYTYAIGSVLYLGLTGFFYFRQRRIHDQQDRIFTVMLIGGFCAVLFDFLAAAIDPYACLHPRWCVYAFNLLFLLGMQTCLPAFCVYALVGAGRYQQMSRPRRALLFVPYGAVLLGLLLSCFSNIGIFYVDAGHVYHHGPLHALLYVSAFFYAAWGGLIVLLFGRDRIPPIKRRVICGFILVLFAVILIQIRYPRYLLTTSATALGLTTIFYVLQSPADHIDPVTGCFNRPVLTTLLMGYGEGRDPYTLLLFYIPAFDLLTDMFGLKASDGLLRELAAYLQSAFPACPIIRMETAQFVVLHNGTLDAAALGRIQAALPTRFSADGVDMRPGLRMAVVHSADHDTVQQALNATDYVFLHCLGEDEGIFVADAAFREKYDRQARLEAAAERLLAEGVALHTAPVLDMAGNTVQLDIILKEKDPAGGAPRELFFAAERAGCMERYYQKLLALAGEHFAAMGEVLPDAYIGLRLSLVFCMQQNAAARLAALCTAAGLSPRQISLGLSQAEEVASLPVLRENIQALLDGGFALHLEDFAAGYTDMDILFELPFSYVRIDESLLRNAVSGGKQTALLEGVLSLLRDLGLRPVCKGAQPADMPLLRRLKVELYRPVENNL